MNDNDYITPKEYWMVFDFYCDFSFLFLESNKEEVYCNPTSGTVIDIFKEKGISYFPDKDSEYFFPLFQLYGSDPVIVFGCVGITDFGEEPSKWFINEVITRVRETSGTLQ